MSEDNKVMKVKRFTMQNVKAVNCFDFEFPEADLITIGGKNNQGKTSVLNGIQYDLGGERYRPTNYKKDNTEGEPVLRLEFTNGIVVQRVGESADLKVWDENGNSQGQTLLNKYITLFALDLPRFLNGSDKDRSEILLKALGVQKEVDDLDARISGEFEERTIIGRLRDQKAKAGKEMPYYEGVPEDEISPADTMSRMQEVNVRNAKILAAKQELDKLNASLVSCIERGDRYAEELSHFDEKVERQCETIDKEGEARIASFEAQIRALQESVSHERMSIAQKKTAVRSDAQSTKSILMHQKEENDKNIEELTEKITSAEGQDFTLETTESFKAELKAIEDTNIKVRENKARAKVLAESKEQAKKYDEKTVIIDDLRKQKDALLEGAGLPYPGLTVENKVVYLNGKAWDCMSESMKIRVGCAIVMRINPSCRFMLVDKLEQLDEDSRNELKQFTKDHNIQIIGTIVSSNPDDCSIIIKNGYILGMEDHMVEIPKITRRKGKKTAGGAKEDATAELSIDAETTTSGIEVVDKALAGEETDAMKKAKELLARRRAQKTEVVE